MWQSCFRFPGFRKKACTLSYDDGMIEDVRLVEIMRKYGVKGTFNLNSKNLESGADTMLSLDAAKELYGDDMEVALHGYKHIVLPAFPSQVGIWDVFSNREHLEKNFKKMVRGYAYPCGEYNDEVKEMLKAAGVVYARTGVSTESFDMPADWLELNPTCHHNNPRLFELVGEFLASPVPNSYQNRKPILFYLWGHSYEFTRHNNWDVIERFCRKMSESDDVWFATNLEIYNYVEAFKRIIISADGSYVYNPTSTKIYMRFFGPDFIVEPGETVRIPKD